MLSRESFHFLIRRDLSVTNSRLFKIKNDYETIKARKKAPSKSNRIATVPDKMMDVVKNSALDSFFENV